MFRIALEIESIQVSSQNVIANFWIEYDGFFFPEKKWSDFILPVFLWWSEEALSINSNNKESYCFFFMDGAYEFTAKSASSETDIYDIAFIESSNGEQSILKTISISKKEFINELISKNLELINSLNLISGIKPSDFKKLVAANKELSNLK